MTAQHLGTIPASAPVTLSIAVSGDVPADPSVLAATARQPAGDPVTAAAAIWADGTATVTFDDLAPGVHVWQVRLSAGSRVGTVAHGTIHVRTSGLADVDAPPAVLLSATGVWPDHVVTVAAPGGLAVWTGDGLRIEATVPGSGSLSGTVLGDIGGVVAVGTVQDAAARLARWIWAPGALDTLVGDTAVLEMAVREAAAIHAGFGSVTVRASVAPEAPVEASQVLFVGDPILFGGDAVTF